MRNALRVAVGVLLIALAGPHPILAQPSERVESLAVGAHKFTVGNVQLWYRLAGRSNGIPVIFLHGGPGEGSQAFQAVGGPELEKTQRLIYFDQRGSGRSDRPKDPSNYSIDILVDDVEQLRRQLDVPRIILLGHSFGTTLALEYAARYPKHTEALVLVAAAPHLARSLDLQCERLAKEDPEAFARASEGVRPGSLPRCNTMRAYTGDAFKAFTLRNLFPDPAVARRVEELDAADGLGNTGEVAGALFRKGLLQYRFSKADEVTAPVLVIAGGKDFQAAIEPQRDLVKELPRGRLIEYPKSGHFVFADDPLRFARDATSFLRDIGR